MFDQDGSSTIDFQEFRSLWRYVTEWEKCFRFVFNSIKHYKIHLFSRKFDLDGSGTIDKHELKTALSSFGMSLV
jgi:hypothetical protein